MSNIRTWFEEYETEFGEPIEAIVVGVHDGRGWGVAAGGDENVILTREDGLRKLDQEYDSGYGGADCYPAYAWTASRVFMIHEYDGATGPVWIPRNPMALAPSFGGQ